jgi:hypothetical protein
MNMKKILILMFLYLLIISCVQEFPIHLYQGIN